jgi:dTDP-4-dehydrorhamnose reductase
MGSARQVPLVLGSQGLIGRAVAVAMEEAFPDTVSAGRAEIDITDRARLEVEVERLRPTMIVNCAAVSDPDACEIDPGRAGQVNVEGASNAARAAAEIGARMIQISSTAVFDGGADHPYTEADAPSPLGELGRTRLEGERGVARHADDHLIVRTSWPYGKGGASFVDAIRRQIADGGVLRAVGDRTGSPTWTSDLAAALLHLLTSRHRGVVHFGNTGSCSRYDVAAAIIAALDAGEARLQRVSTEEAGGIVRRPANEALDTTLYTRLTGHVPRDWRGALQSYLRGGDCEPIEG